MKGLFYLSGIILVLAVKMLIWGIKNNKRKEIIVASVAVSVCLPYAVYYLFFLD